MVDRFTNFLMHPATQLGAAMMAGFDPRREGLGGLGGALLTTGAGLREQQRYEAEQERSRQLADLQMRTMQAKLAQLQKPTPGIEVGGRVIHPVTGQVIYEPPGGVPALEPKEKASVANTLRDDFERQTSTFQGIQHNWEVLQGAENTAIGDVSRTYAFLKMIDPGAAVQEGDKANISNAGGVPAWVRALYNQALGEGLDAGKRRQLEREAGRIFNNALGDYNLARKRFQGLGAQYGIGAEAVTPTKTYEPYIPPPAGFIED